MTEKLLVALKTCSKCGQPKPLSAFYKNSSSSDGLRRDCKLCWSTKTMEIRMENQERARDQMRQYGVKNAEVLKNSYLVRNYQITLDQYLELFETQGGCVRHLWHASRSQGTFCRPRPFVLSCQKYVDEES